MAMAPEIRHALDGMQILGVIVRRAAEAAKLAALALHRLNRDLSREQGAIISRMFGLHRIRSCKQGNSTACLKTKDAQDDAASCPPPNTACSSPHP